jgi:manganese/zinc/iron transport system substrate-binding protein
MKKIFSLLVLVSSVLLVAGCGGEKAKSSDAKPKVVATVAMVADVARYIAGDRFDVVALIGTGIDPHLYKPTREDQAQLRSADLVLYAGLHLEGKMVEELEALGKTRPVLAVSEAIDRSLLLADGEGEKSHDPHVWMDPAMWSQIAVPIAEKMATLDPAGAEQFRERAASYQKQLAELDAYGKKILATIPKESRVLITSHDAFSYLGRAYSIEVNGVQGLSTESEAGIRRVNELVDLIVTRKVGAVFIESSVSDKSIRGLIEGAQARGAAVKVGGELFSDAMGKAGTYEGTYIGMIDHNLTLIARALGGDAPAGGFQGKLAHETGK